MIVGTSIVDVYSVDIGLNQLSIFFGFHVHIWLYYALNLGMEHMECFIFPLEGLVEGLTRFGFLYGCCSHGEMVLPLKKRTLLLWLASQA